MAPWSAAPRQDGLLTGWVGTLGSSSRVISVPPTTREASFG